MEETMKRERETTENQVGDLRLTPTLNELGDSNNNGTKVQLNAKPMFGFHAHFEEDEVQ